LTFLKSLSVQVLVALLAGLGLGALAAAYGGAAATPMIEGVEALGGLWLNALRMTVVPLIFAVLVTGIAQVADAAATGRLAMKAVDGVGGYCGAAGERHIGSMAGGRDSLRCAQGRRPGASGGYAHCAGLRSLGEEPGALKSDQGRG
jgi:hypothetical protein